MGSMSGFNPLGSSFCPRVSQPDPGEVYQHQCLSGSLDQCGHQHLCHDLQSCFQCCQHPLYPHGENYAWWRSPHPGLWDQACLACFVSSFVHFGFQPGLLPLPLTSLTLPEVVCKATTMMCTPLEAPFAAYVALGSRGHLQSDEADLRLLQILNTS